jgi:hypothetical protein
MPARPARWRQLSAGLAKRASVSPGLISLFSFSQSAWMPDDGAP